MISVRPFVDAKTDMSSPEPNDWVIPPLSPSHFLSIASILIHIDLCIHTIHIGRAASQIVPRPMRRAAQ